MRTRSRWSQWARRVSDGWPHAPLLDTGTQRGMVIGAGLAGLLFLVLGAVQGAANRGAIGGVVGALSAAAAGIAFGAVGGAIVVIVSRLGGDSVALEISMDHPDSRYAPGEAVVAQVTLTCKSAVRLKGATAYLLCRGFYSHDQANADMGSDGTEASSGADSPYASERDVQQILVQETEAIPAGSWPRGTTQSYSFRFRLPPDALPTHQGYICSLRWTLHVVADAFAHSGDSSSLLAKAQRELLVEAVPPMMGLGDRNYQSMTPHGSAHLTMMLPRAICAEGDTLRGDVHIRSLEHMTGAEVRAVLMRIENVPIGDGHTVYVAHWDPEAEVYRGERRRGGVGTTYVWLEDEARLSSDLQLAPGEETVLPFTLEVPSHWRPTLRTPNGQVVWKVGIVVHRKAGPDLRTLHEVIVHTSDNRPSEDTVPREIPYRSPVRGRVS